MQPQLVEERREKPGLVQLVGEIPVAVPLLDDEPLGDCLAPRYLRRLAKLLRSPFSVSEFRAVFLRLLAIIGKAAFLNPLARDGEVAVPGPVMVSGESVWVVSHW